MHHQQMVVFLNEVTDLVQVHKRRNKIQSKDRQIFYVFFVLQRTVLNQVLAYEISDSTALSANTGNAWFFCQNTLPFSSHNQKNWYHNDKEATGIILKLTQFLGDSHKSTMKQRFLIQTLFLFLFSINLRPILFKTV